ncbi:MAG: HmuY family protein [Archangium sp.]|nr:HmuY family protein [Archangium sp.]
MHARLSLVVMALAVSACRPADEPCGPTTCAGCCDAAGECQAGNTVAACGGTAGGMCAVCTEGNGCFSGACGPIVTTPACDPTPVTCSDQSVMQLDFRAPTASGPVMTTSADGVYSTYVDARAGGLNPTESYTYVRFTDAGVERVALSDESSLTSVAWDMAFRRYVLRINSGVGGPSCVQAARTAPMTSFESVTSVDPGLAFRTEAYFTSTCDIIPDGSGLDAPATAMASFWTYQNCVRMTGNVYVVKLANGRPLKLQVQSYYDVDKQAVCDSTGSVPMPNGAGQLRFRWAFLE